MADIDLRPKEKLTSEIKLSAPEQTEKPDEIIQWSAFEPVYRKQGPYWFILPGAIGLVLVLFGILAKSYFFTAFVVLASIVFFLYAERRPREIEFIIDGEGIRIKNRLTPYAELKSFWIFELPDTKELSFETSKLTNPFLRLPLEDIDPLRVREMLSHYLPEKEHRESITDQIAKGFGF